MGREVRKIFVLQLFTLKYTAMKEMIDMLFNDNKSFDGMPWWVYAFVFPIGLIALMAIVGNF